MNIDSKRRFNEQRDIYIQTELNEIKSRQMLNRSLELGAEFLDNALWSVCSHQLLAQLILKKCCAAFHGANILVAL